MSLVLAHSQRLAVGHGVLLQAGHQVLKQSFELLEAPQREREISVEVVTDCESEGLSRNRLSSAARAEYERVSLAHGTLFGHQRGPSQGGIGVLIGCVGEISVNGL